MRSIVLLLLLVFLTSCSQPRYFCWDETVVTYPSKCTACAETKTKCKTVETYGWLDWDTKEPCVKYDVNVPNAIWSVLLVETIVAPLFITGYDIMEPVGVKQECHH